MFAQNLNESGVERGYFVAHAWQNSDRIDGRGSCCFELRKADAINRR
jgi:hypothetical protein